jgi:hypothetical protein
VVLQVEVNPFIISPGIVNPARYRALLTMPGGEFQIMKHAGSPPAEA